MSIGEASNWLKVDEYDVTTINDGLIQRFLMYIYEGVVDPKEAEFTPNLWETSLKACQWFLNT